ncbi:MAG: sugar isomerase domain-containing protein [Anaerolineae bacterium]|nr:sugar isomerase domain-containing protein [Thermoflexales bacterium]MDW8408727.1 sugar isomerase domain-containing protein [Anaerolineae bacterium]
MSLIDTYFNEILSRIAEMCTTRRQQIEQAAEVCARCLMNKGVVHIHDTGHLVSAELIKRAGGLVAFSRLNLGLQIDNPNPYRESRPNPNGPQLGFIPYALRAGNVRTGDVLIIGSVSGRTALQVELALQARALSVTTIALTAIAHSSQLTSEHPSGKRLYEVTDLVLDHPTDYGDAMIDVPGVEHKVLPASGVLAAVMLWAVTAGIIERMTAAGMPPTVYRSINLPGGPESVKAVERQYAERGY